MNEYQDQSVWYEVQEWSSTYQRWIMITDHDTRDEAAIWIKENDPELLYGMRIKRVTGLDD